MIKHAKDATYGNFQHLTDSRKAHEETWFIHMKMIRRHTKNMGKFKLNMRHHSVFHTWDYSMQENKLTL